MDTERKQIKILGLGVCGKGEAGFYMKKTLEEFKRLCNKTIIATNDATQAEIDLIEKYGFEHYEDNRVWGMKQPFIKSDLLAHAKDYNPDWIVALDMDEQFCPEVTREVLERLASTEEIGWYFMIVNLYGDDKHFAHDIGIKRFWNVRYYKYMPELGLQFQEKRLHCGIAPPYAYKFGWYAPYYINHRGLMTQGDRQRKTERYNKYDPDARYIPKQYYDDLKRELRPIPFNRKKLLEQLRDEKSCQPRITPKPWLNEEKKVEIPKQANTLIKGGGVIRI